MATDPRLDNLEAAAIFIGCALQTIGLILAVTALILVLR